MIKTFYELYTDIKQATRETQIDNYIKDWINLTLNEINDPGWAYEQIGVKGYNHNWSFNRRKYTLTTSSSTEFYQLPRDVDKLSVVRITSSPRKVTFLPDDVFYKYVPSPTATGTPDFYRLWEEEGVSTRLSTDDTITVKSSSTSDSSSFTVSVVGYDTNGLIRSDVLTLNGTTAVNGTITFDAGRPLRVSKSGTTTGVITVEETTSGTDLVLLSPEDRSPRFKIIGLYPIPSSTLSIYVEYYTRIRNLVNNSDVPDIDEKWIWVVRLGAMAKVYQYQNKETMFNLTQNQYGAGVRSMVKSDMQNVDYIPMLAGHRERIGPIEFTGEGYGSYGLTF